MVFNNCEYALTTSEIIDYKTVISWRNFLDRVINDFKIKGDYFNHVAELNFITLANKMNTSYDLYIKHNMHAVERKINKITAENPNLINSLNRFHNHPLIRNYSHTSLNN